MTDLSNMLLALCSGFGVSLCAGLAWMVRNLIKNTSAVEHLEKRFEDRFEQVDRRFEQVDKRFKQVIEQMDKRFEQVIEQMDKRFEQVDKRFEQVIEQMDKRFEQVEKRFDQLERNSGRLEDKFDYLVIALANNLGIQNAQPKSARKSTAAKLSHRPENI